MPVLTLTLSLIMLGIYFIPELSTELLYDRQAIFSGQFWRILTGHWVHFSNSHLIYNLMGFAIAGSMIEHRHYPGLALLYVMSSGFIGIGLLIFEPNLDYYAGISGVTYAAIIYFSIYGLNETGYWRVLCWVILLGTLIKLLVELSQQGFIFVNSDTAFAEITLSHLLGTLAALCLYGYHVSKAHKKLETLSCKN